MAGYGCLISPAQSVAKPERRQMTEVLESVITATMLRTAIRAKIDAGVSRRAISLLINANAPPGAGRGREDDSGVRRVPVGVIEDGQAGAVPLRGTPVPA